MHSKGIVSGLCPNKPSIEANIEVNNALNALQRKEACLNRQVGVRVVNFTIYHLK